MYQQNKSILCIALFTFLCLQSVYSQDANPWKYDSSETNTQTQVRTNAPTVVLPRPAPAAPPSQTAQSPQFSPKPASTHQKTKTSSPSDKLLKMGIGIQSGVRFHNPDQLNDFISAIYNSFLSNDVYEPIDKKTIAPGVFLTLNGSFDIGRHFQIVPFAQGMWAGKQFFFSGGIVKDFHANTYTALGGVNLWGRVFNYKRTTLRLGAGAHGTHTIVRITGDVPDEAIFSATSFGFRLMVGTEINLNESFTLTLDGAFPFGTAEFDKGFMSTADGRIAYPEEFKHSGFELLPGIVYYF